MSERETLHRGDVGSQFCLFPKIYNVQREKEGGQTHRKQQGPKNRKFCNALYTTFMHVFCNTEGNKQEPGGNR